MSDPNRPLRVAHVPLILLRAPATMITRHSHGSRGPFEPHECPLIMHHPSDHDHQALTWLGRTYWPGGDVPIMGHGGEHPRISRMGRGCRWVHLLCGP